MNRYINADEAREALRADFCENFFYDIDEYETVLGFLDSLPFADVVEVKHGEWVSSYRTWEFTFECSVCGKVAYEESNFCPNCGADMRGESNDK